MQNKLALALIVLLLIPSANALLGDADRDGNITSADMDYYNTILNGKAPCSNYRENCPSPYGRNLDLDGDLEIGTIDKSILNLILNEKRVCSSVEKRMCMGNAPAQVNVVDLISGSNSGSFRVEVRNNIWKDNDYGVLGNQVYGVETQETVPAGIMLDKQDNITNPPQLCPDGQICTNPYINYTYTITQPGIFDINIKTVEQHLNAATTLPSVETTLTLVSDFDNDGYDYTADCDDSNPEYTTDCDLDDDGYDYTVDCDDSNFTINPGATEFGGNGIDEDCDGADLTIDGYIYDGLNWVYHTLTSIICGVEPTTNVASLYTGDTVACGILDPSGMGCGYYLLNVTQPFSLCHMSTSKDGYEPYDSLSIFDIGIGFRTEDITLTESTVSAGYFTGRVLDDTTFLPISTAYVKLIKESTSEVLQVVKTDASGDFLIKGVPIGFSYNLTAEATGCTPSFEPTGQSVNPGDTQNVGLILMDCPPAPPA